MINTDRFILRPLTSKDVNSNYLLWLNVETSGGYIEYAKTKSTIEDLKKYIQDREYKKEVLFLGIFTKNTEQHIGNIKYEPIDFREKKATMGILIGSKSWRGKGVASEVILASCQYLRNTHDINSIFLGVDKGNAAAIKAYQKVGFELSASAKNRLMMLLKLN